MRQVKFVGPFDNKVTLECRTKRWKGREAQDTVLLFGDDIVKRVRGLTTSFGECREVDVLY